MGAASVGFVVTAMPARAEGHPVLADHPDPQGLRGHPVALCGGLERIRAEEVFDVPSHHCFVVVVYDGAALVRYEREPVPFNVFGAVVVGDDRSQSAKAISGLAK